ncbi:MAG: STAS domain-containing protein [Actinomycetota bacterium]|nr:STAS domain-containing protein [Actinomycetota bacterium]
MTAPRESPTICVRVPCAGVEPNRIELVVTGAIKRRDVLHLCLKTRALLDASRAKGVTCDVGRLDEIDVATVDMMARLQLSAIRADRRITFVGVSADLRRLLVLMGLTDVLALAPSDARKRPG